MNSKNVCDVLVLDSGPIIKNEPAISTLLASGSTLVTSPTVVTELKDEKTRLRIQTQLVPFLEQRSSKPQSLRFVSEFAKKSGDFSVLSKTDLEILALTYETECDKAGSSHLRTFPGQKSIKAKSNACSDIPPPESNSDVKDGTASSTQQDREEVNYQSSKEPDLCQAEEEQYAEDLKTLEIDDSPEPHERVGQGPLQQSNTNPEIPNQGVEASDSEGSEAWITPSNLKKHLGRDLYGTTSSSQKQEAMHVACITTDYAMQNVLLQIGLNVLSPNLQRIRKIKTYILRCHGCFQQVKDTSKQFCPRCGNPTLTRVSCSTDHKGVFRIHLKKKMEWHHRGDRYSVPKPVHGSASGKAAKTKGGGTGGWGQSLILAEDQKEYQRATEGKKVVKAKDLMDEEYLPSILMGRREKPGSRPKVGAGRNVNARKRMT